MDGRGHRGRGAPARVQLDQGVRPAVQRPLPRRQDLPRARGDGRARSSPGCTSTAARAARVCATSAPTPTPGPSARRSTSCCGSSRPARAAPACSAATARSGAPACSATSTSAPRRASAGSPRTSTATSSTTSASSSPAARTGSCASWSGAWRPRRDELEFERAARLRDDLGALRRAMEKQAVVLGDGTDADVVAFAQDELEAAVQVFHVRGGRVRGQRGWVIDKVEPTETPALVERFLTQFYGEQAALAESADDAGQPVPREILVPELPPDVDALAEWLCGLRGSRVADPRPAARRQAGAGRDRRAQRQGGVHPAQAAPRRRPHGPLRGAAGDPGRARARQRAPAHRVRRRLARAGQRRRGVAGGVRGRAGPQVGLPALRDPRRRRGRRRGRDRRGHPQALPPAPDRNGRRNGRWA